MSQPTSIIYAVDITRTDGQLLVPADSTLKPFKVCFPIMDDFVKKHGRNPANGDLYVLTVERKKMLVTPEEFKELVPSPAFFHRKFKEKVNIGALLVE